MTLISKTFSFVLVAVWLANGFCASAEVIPLGNLFDDLRSSNPTLNAAIASDTFAEVGNTDDLGVITLQTNLNGSQVVAPGVNFDLTNAGGGNGSFDFLRNDAAYFSQPIRTSGTAVNEQGIGIHANRLVTFDLDEIRAAATTPIFLTSFTGKGALDDTSSTQPQSSSVRAIVLVTDSLGQVTGYINGTMVAVTNNAGVWSFTGTIPAELKFGSANASALFNVPLTATSRYLSLAMTGGASIDTDQAVFSAAQLNFVIPEPGAGVLAVCAFIGLFVTRCRKRRTLQANRDNTLNTASETRARSQ